MFAAMHMWASSDPFIAPHVQASRLCNAAFGGDLEEIEKLVEKEAVSVHCKNKHGQTPLMSAIAGNTFYDDTNVVTYLLLHGASTKRYNLYGYFFSCPLEWAVGNESAELCALLLAADASGFEKVDNEKCSTVLEYARWKEQENHKSQQKNPKSTSVTANYIASKKIRTMIEKKCKLDTKKLTTRPPVISWYHLHKGDISYYKTNKACAKQTPDSRS